MSRKKLQGAVDITRGHQTLRVSPWTDSKTGKRHWRFSIEKDGTRSWITRSTKDAACAAAEQWLEESPQGIVFSLLPPQRRRWLEELHRQVRPEDQTKILAFVTSLHRSSDVGEAVTRFIALKVTKAGEETPHLARIRTVLSGMATHFTGRNVAEIHLPDLEDWWTLRCAGCEWKRRNDIRDALVGFWKWCRREQLVPPDPDTVASRLPVTASESHALAIIEDRETFEKCALAVAVEFRAWFVLGTLAGMRPEEVSPGPQKKKTKRGLLKEEIRWNFKSIRIPPEVSKVDTPRVVPMNEALRLGLEWAGIKEGQTGPVSTRNAAKSGETKRLGDLIFGGTWPKDILRHTYASFRNAVLRNLHQVAEEMGTSVAILNKNYHNPRDESEGTAFFENAAEFFRKQLLLTPLNSAPNSPAVSDDILEEARKFNRLA